VKKIVAKKADNEKFVNFGISMPKEDKEKMTILAKTEKISVSELIRNKVFSPNGSTSSASDNIKLPIYHEGLEILFGIFSQLRKDSEENKELRSWMKNYGKENQESIKKLKNVQQEMNK
jgi:hypothetical protein